MKKANIYKVVVKDKSVKDGKVQVICIAESLADAIRTVAPTIFNSELKEYKVVKYKESDILEILLLESGAIVQDYISEYKEEE